MTLLSGDAAPAPDTTGATVPRDDRHPRPALREGAT